MPDIRIGITTATIVALMLGCSTATYAQMPTTAQRNAIRQSCARDYQAMCSSVPPGGSASLQCLSEHMASLAPACQSAVGAISSGGGQPSRTPAYPTATARPGQACRGDFMEFCRGIRPGGGRAMMCLRQHAMELSPGCQQSLQALRR